MTDLDKLQEWQASQHYRYIGRDGKPVLARDLEARAEDAEAPSPARMRRGGGMLCYNLNYAVNQSAPFPPHRPPI